MCIPADYFTGSAVRALPADSKGLPPFGNLYVQKACG